MVTDDAVESEEVQGGAGDEKMGIFGEISLVELIFEFFLFSKSTGDCDLTRPLEGPILKCWDVTISVWV